MKLFVGNLPFSATEDELRSAFEAHGEVSDVALIMDRETGRPRGFAFVEMPDSGQANAAIEALNNSDFGGRSMNVNEARPREDRPRGGGGGGGFRGGGGGGGYRGGGGGGNRGGW
jgi:RNA recognition motif-containing protein